MHFLTTLFISAVLFICIAFSAEQNFQDKQTAAKLARQIVKDTGKERREDGKTIRIYLNHI
jgi:hypothetical protein